MNTLKPLLICAVLAGIGYGVYVRINKGNNGPPPGVPQDWSASPEVQMGDATMPGDVQVWPGDASGAPGAAAPFAASAPPAASGAVGGETPPFDTPSVPQRGADVRGSAPPFDSSTAAPPVHSHDPPEAARTGPQSYPPAGGSDLSVPPLGAGGPLTADRYQASDTAMPDRYEVPQATPPDPYGTPASAAPGAGAAEVYPTPDGGLPPQPTGPEGTFAEAIDGARRELEAGQLVNVLQKLSRWHDDPRLAPAEQQQLNQLLDQIAGTVVYSTQNLLEPPYEVQPGERLDDIAARYQVPSKLLAKINGIDDPDNLRPGERLKVVRGPFDAVVNLEKRELTLMLAGKMYAGRFPIGIGVDQPPRAGSYTVSDRVENPVYHGRNRVISAGEAGNPYGTRWIGLGADLGIHGTDRNENIGRTDLPGSISLSSEHIEDVFDILATGSTVTIRR